MKKMKKVLSIVLTTALVMSTLAGCSSKKNDDTTSSNNQATTAPTQSVAPTGTDTSSTDAGTQDLTTIDWYVDMPTFQWGGAGFGQDLTSKMIEEKTGVKINFIVPASDDHQQLSSMVAAGTLPDIITVNGWWDSNTRLLDYQLATQGYLWSYNDLMDQYAPDMKSNIRQDVFDWFAESDGKTYEMPNYAYSNQDLKPGEQLVPNGCITIRKDLYEAIGSPDMSTPEGFLDACQKIKDTVKQYNGQDIIPIQLYEGVGNSILWLAQYFATPYEDSNGNYLYDFTQDNYKEALKFLNTAYQRGLISDANFSDTRDLVNEKVASGRVFCMITAPQDFTAQMQSLYDTDPKAVYEPVVLKNSKGEDPVLQDIRGFGWLTTEVSKNTKYPDKIAKLINYLISDQGQIDMYYGQEGVTYNKNADGTISYTDEYNQALANNDTKKYALGSMYLLDNYAYRRQFEVAPTDPKLLATTDTIIKQPMEKYSYDYSAAGFKFDPQDSRKEAMAQLSVQVTNYRQTAIAELVTAKDDAAFEARYKQAVDDLNAMGLKDLITYDNDGFQAAKKALGIDHSWAPLLKK